MNNEIMKNRAWKIGIAVGILLSFFLAVISIKEIKAIRYVKDPLANSITVNGKGEAVSIPDVATFSFSVTETAKTVDEAQAKATTKIDATLKALKDGGVNDKDIKTLSYNINPHYEYIEGSCVAGGPCRPGKSVPTGYDVSQSVEVKIRDLKKAGALFSSVGAAGIQNVNGLTFSIDDIETIKSKARNLAIENAKEKAKTLAKQLGVSLVRITSFFDGSEEPPFYASAMTGEMMKTLSTPAVMTPQVPAGEQKVISKVSVTYEIR